MVAWGDGDSLQSRIGEFVLAGANHVAIIPLGADGTTENVQVLEALAAG